jgi:hypothetical protein
MHCYKKKKGKKGGACFMCVCVCVCVCVCIYQHLGK